MHPEGAESRFAVHAIALELATQARAVGLEDECAGTAVEAACACGWTRIRITWRAVPDVETVGIDTIETRNHVTGTITEATRTRCVLRARVGFTLRSVPEVGSASSSAAIRVQLEALAGRREATCPGNSIRTWGRVTRYVDADEHASRFLAARERQNLADSVAEATRAGWRLGGRTRGHAVAEEAEAAESRDVVEDRRHGVVREESSLRRVRDEAELARFR